MKRWFKKFIRGRITLIIVPPSSQQTSRFMVSPTMMLATITGLVFFLVLVSTVTFLYFQGRADIKNVHAIKNDNQQKAEAIKYVDQEIDAIEAEQQNIDAKQKELQKMMGIKTDPKNTATPSRGGQGGVDQASGIADDVEALIKIEIIKTSLYRQESELDELLARVGNNQDYFRCIPNGWPLKGVLTSDYGYRKSPFGSRNETFHNGIDIAGNVGTEVLAAGNGKVIKAEWEGAYGRAIVIDHGYGLSTMYGHNSKLLVSAGDMVYKGQTIALSGNSGRSTGPHLHFTLKRYGQPIDPMVYLPKWQ